MNHNDINTLQIIKSEVQRKLPGCQVMLFGSRARGDFHEDSDYDILVICPEIMETTKKLKIRSAIRKSLMKFDILSDVFVETIEEIRQKKQLPGHVIHYAMQEAIEI